MSNFASGYIKYINHLEQINDAATSDPERMIFEVEDSYHEHIQNIARNIATHHGNARICMLAGPSSSGKTTTAHLLQNYLREFGISSHIVSMDNFYLDRELVPLLPDGRKDFETVDALDVKGIEECLMSIVNSDTIEVPSFDFALGRAVGEKTVINIGCHDIVIMEGLHALNPVFTKNLPEENLIKLYVSVKQQIKDANGEVISPFDLRLVRRIVRDMQFRATEPERTIMMWDNVVAGEDKYIRPYRLSADYTVNSIHIYEPCVLRTMAIPIIRRIPADSPVYRKARELDARLMRFEPVAADLVPDNSMLREFIGKRR